jgi:hypothetical protein
VVAWRAVGVVVALGVTLVLTSAPRIDAHPLHTTLTEVTVTPSSRAIRATVRLFEDDLAASMKRAGKPVENADVVTYVGAGFGMLDAGRPLPMRGCGVRRQSGVIWACFEATLASGVGEISLRNTLLGETFKDQVNIVQVVLGGAKRSLVFTRGDGAKRLI